MIKPACACLFLLLILNSGLTAGSKGLKTFTEPAYRTTIEKMVAEIYRENYSAGFKLLKENVPVNSLYHLYFKGLLHMAVFNDLGDTSSLAQAQNTWSVLEKKIEWHKKKRNNPPGLVLPLDLYHGLTLVQLSYIYQIKNKTVKSALTGKKGIKLLRKQNKYVETLAITAIYEYYKQQFMEYFDWIPFVSGDSKKARIKLKKYYNGSPYLGNILLTSLIWMHFDEGLYQEGLNLTKPFLKKYPHNRLFRSIRADLLYKLGRHKESRDLFEEIKSEYDILYESYPEKKCIKAPYLSILGNLIRVNHALGNKKEQQKYAAVWFSKETKKIQKWLPKSLLKDLKRFEP